MKCPVCGTHDPETKLPGTIVRIEDGFPVQLAILLNGQGYHARDLREDGRPRNDAYPYFIGVTQFLPGHPRHPELHGEYEWFDEERERDAQLIREQIKKGQKRLLALRQKLLAIYL